MMNNLINFCTDVIMKQQYMTPTIIEDFSDIKTSVKDDVLEMGEDTVTYLNNYVDQLETDVNKQKLKEYLKSIYIEASDKTA